MTRKIIAILISFGLIACNQSNFDSNKWKNDDPAFYSEREKMVTDIINKELVLKKDTAEIFKILGKCDWMDTTQTGKIKKIFYTVKISYGFDIDPKFYAYLIIDIDTLTNKSKLITHDKSGDRRGFLEKVFTN